MVNVDMQRWILYLIGAVLLAMPFILDVVQPQGALGMAGVSSGLPTWMHLSVSAGPYLLNWGPALVGVLIIYYANRDRR